MRLPFPRFLILATVLLTVPSCVSGGSSSATRGSGPITQDEIVDIPVRDAYEVVQRLRPAWLRTRGRLSIQNPEAQGRVNYVDSIRFGDAGSLREISADAVEEIRYMGAGDATTRFGMGHAGGVILVRTRR